MEKGGRYLEVPLNLLEDVLAGAAQQNGAGLRLLAVLDEREVPGFTRALAKV
jgi:hypothetical protein